jgi:hypothetical protein
VLVEDLDASTALDVGERELGAGLGAERREHSTPDDGDGEPETDHNEAVPVTPPAETSEHLRPPGQGWRNGMVTASTSKSPET